MKVSRWVKMLLGFRSTVPPVVDKDPPEVEEARQRLLHAQATFFEAVAGVVEENRRLREQRGHVYAKKNIS